MTGQENKAGDAESHEIQDGAVAGKTITVIEPFYSVGVGYDFGMTYSPALKGGGFPLWLINRYGQ